MIDLGLKVCRPSSTHDSPVSTDPFCNTHGNCDNRKIDSSIRVSILHNNDGSNRLQYRKIQFNGMLLSIDERDNCCILHDGSICIVFNILMINS